VTAFTLCEDCGTPIGAFGHWRHDEGCDEVSRALGEQCRCVGTWACVACCPDPVCGPLQTASIAAKADVVARAEAAEALYEPEAS
jgi:hypothetical protein